MKRRALQALSLLSLLLCTAIVILWIRSARLSEDLTVPVGHNYLSLGSAESIIAITWVVVEAVEFGEPRQRTYVPEAEWSHNVLSKRPLLVDRTTGHRSYTQIQKHDSVFGFKLIRHSDHDPHTWSLCTRYGIALPYYFLALLGLIGPTWTAFRLFSERRMRQAGYCSSCGYDLRASEIRCPECGYPICENERPGLRHQTSQRENA